jgi:hypothetical protein
MAKLPRLTTQLKPITPTKMRPAFYFKERSLVISEEHKNNIIVVETKISFISATKF